MPSAETEPAPLTDAERKAIRALVTVAKTWPRSLWLYSASGSLLVMKKTRDGSRPVKSGSPDEAFAVGQIFGITNDGGDF